MADFALDGAYDECDDYDRFASGYYSGQEAYDRGFINEMGGEESGPKGWNTLFQPSYTESSKSSKSLDHGVTCKKCGERDLRWKQHESGKWWLAYGDDWHTCQDIDD
jgi:hypothetical protein